MIEPINMLRAGVVNMSDAALLVCAGRAGIGGVTTVQAVAECRLSGNTVQGCFMRLREMGLVCPPTRDTGVGRVNRYVMTPKGLELLQQAAGVGLGKDRQTAMKLKS